MKNRSFRKAMAATLAMAMGLMVVAVPVPAEETTAIEEPVAVETTDEAAGTENLTGENQETGIGGNWKWAFDAETGTMTISSATGQPVAMSGDFGTCNAEWYQRWDSNAKSQIRRLVFDDSITAIGSSAFLECANLADIDIPSSVTQIGRYAFCGAAITSLTIPSGVTEIGNGAFGSCRSLENVDINGDAVLGEYVFANCDKLQSIHVSDASSHYSSYDGAVYTKDGGTLLICPVGKTTLKIADSATTIGSESCASCVKLEKIELSANVQTIEDRAFEGCEKLTDVSFPSSMSKIKSNIFSGCTAKVNIKFEGDAPSIAEDAFSYQTGEWDQEKQQAYVAEWKVSADAYYSQNNTTWTEDKRKDYGGKIDWIAYDGAAGNESTLSQAGIYVASQDGNGVVAGMVTEGTAADKEYRWLSYDINSGTWSVYQDWTKGSEWIQYNPGKAGDYLLQGEVRIAGHPDSAKTECIGVNHHPNIKGKCQMPYTGEGGGYLIGVESYDNPDDSYSYELLVLDCTKYAAGDPNPWIYTTGKKQVNGNAFWTIWQPEYGYYWTLFRVYDKDGNMIDQDCYSFQNI